MSLCCVFQVNISASVWSPVILPSIRSYSEISSRWLLNRELSSSSDNVKRRRRIYTWILICAIRNISMLYTCIVPKAVLHLIASQFYRALGMGMVCHDHCLASTPWVFTTWPFKTGWNESSRPVSNEKACVCILDTVGCVAFQFNTYRIWPPSILMSGPWKDCKKANGCNS